MKWWMPDAHSSRRLSLNLCVGRTTLPTLYTNKVSHIEKASLNATVLCVFAERATLLMLTTTCA